MIEIVRLNDFSLPTDKAIVPPQLSTYYANIIDSELDKTYVIYAEEKDIVKEQLNFAIMKRSFGNFLVSMPYIGYGSCFDRKNVRYLKDLFSELEQFALENNCLTMSVCTHSLSSLPFESYRSIFDYSYYYKNICQISKIDIHPLLTMTHKRRMAFKNEISKIEKKPEYFIDKEPDKYIFEKWFEVYHKRFEDIGGIPTKKDIYIKYYNESRKNDKIDFWVLRSDSTLLGGIFFVVGKDIVDYDVSAFSTEYRKLYPATYMLNEYFKKMLDQGIRYFNWQGSGGHEGVRNYKSRWGAEEYNHYYFSKNLVDIKEITSIPLSKIKNELTRCYVLPYSLWENRK